ncbi:MAG: hypothetical protein C0592_11890 [Marinilabiliales bacterium]|nr:MAG: hypothetical protein C0592_11890 [Marinilabiliales bacterium]
MIVVISSCKRDRGSDNYRSAIDNATAENMFNDVFKQASDGIIAAEDSTDGRAVNSMLSTCATITINPFDFVTFPKTITVDFGTTNCLGNDGRYRRGKVVMNTTGWYRDSGTVITVTPENYYVNDNFVQGTKTLTNNGHNTSGNLTYTLQVNGTVTTSEGIIYWNSTRQHEWIEGESTVLNPWDDVYLITGSADGTNVQGEDFDVVINTPLRVQVGCRWITAGSMTLTSGDFTISVDYGSGACDADAVVTINGNTYNIVMM